MNADPSSVNDISNLTKEAIPEPTDNYTNLQEKVDSLARTLKILKKNFNRFKFSLVRQQGLKDEDIESLCPQDVWDELNQFKNQAEDRINRLTEEQKSIKEEIKSLRNQMLLKSELDTYKTETGQKISQLTGELNSIKEVIKKLKSTGGCNPDPITPGEPTSPLNPPDPEPKEETPLSEPQDASQETSSSHVTGIFLAVLFAAFLVYLIHTTSL